MSGYKNLPQRGGKRNGATFRYRPNGLRASNPQMTERQKDFFDSSVQRPSQLVAMVMNDDIRCDQFDPEDWIEIEQAIHNREIFEESLEIKAENKALKAKIAALEAENAALKSQQSSPPAPQILGKTGYRDAAVAISPETIQKMKLANFFRRVRLYFILLDAFNRLLDDDEAEIEGCGSVLRKIFELVTNISADISENTLTIPDLDFKFYGSKSDFEAFAKKVSEWIIENGLNIPGTHFIIGKMYRFTKKKMMPNGQIIKYEKFTLEVIDSSTKEIFMIDIMNIDGSIVFPCDFSVNSLAVSPKRGIYAKDPLHRKGKFNFLDFIRDIFSKTTTCMMRTSWESNQHSLIFLSRGIKMIEAGYKMQGAPVLTTATCPIMQDDNLCVSLTGCRCSDTKGKQIPVQMSICATIGIFEEKRCRCPNCRSYFKEFVCFPVEPKQSMPEPKKLPTKDEYKSLVERAEQISQSYLFSIFMRYSQESKDNLMMLNNFSRQIENAEKDDQMRAGGGAAAPDFDPLIRAVAPVPAPQVRAGGGAAAPVHAPQMRAGGGAAAPVPAPQVRAGGGAAAPVRRRQYDSDGGYIRRIGS